MVIASILISASVLVLEERRFAFHHGAQVDRWRWHGPCRSL